MNTLRRYWYIVLFALLVAAVLWWLAMGMTQL